MQPLSLIPVPLSIKSPLPYISIRHRHAALIPFVLQNDRRPSSLSQISVLRSIGLDYPDVPFLEKVLYCVPYFQVKWMVPTPPESLCFLFNLSRYPSERLKLIYLCDVSSCRNPWHWQSVVLSFDEDAWRKSKLMAKRRPKPKSWLVIPGTRALK